jgi:hypothetical protein
MKCTTECIFDTYYRVEYRVFNISRFFKRLLVWIPILWNDHDWDYTYLFIMMEKKLSLMREYHETKGLSMDRQKIAKQIKTCEVLLKRIIADEYPFSNTKPHSSIDSDCKYLGMYMFKHVRGWWD